MDRHLIKKVHTYTKLLQSMFWGPSSLNSTLDFLSVFRLSVFCGKDPKIVKAEPEDLIIVCGESSVEIENQFNSKENEVNLYFEICFYLSILLSITYCI